MAVDLEDVNQKMVKLVEHVKTDVATIRTGRATPALVENIVVKAYGGSAQMRVLELAGVVALDTQSLLITPFDQSVIGEIRRDIEAANVGLTPVIDNNLIRITVPPLTGERRLEYIKMLHTKLEDGRVKIRQVRHEKMGDIKRRFEASELNEDDRNHAEDELQKLTDQKMAEVEAVGKVKQAELAG